MYRSPIDLRALICTGRCNPYVAKLDEQIARYRHTEALEGHAVRLPINDESLLAQLHGLKHRPHGRTQANDGTWVCLTCNHERRA